MQHFISELHALMAETPVDYTLFWRELSNLPKHVADCEPASTRHTEAMQKQHSDEHLGCMAAKLAHGFGNKRARNPAEVSAAMKRVNPKYIPREWMLVEAYRNATDSGDFTLVHKCMMCWKTPTTSNPRRQQRCITKRRKRNSLTWVAHHTAVARRSSKACAVELGVRKINHTQ